MFEKKLIIIVVQVGAVKIYVTAVETDHATSGTSIWMAACPS